VVGYAGLLDGRRFTGHWSDRERLRKRHPGATHVPNRRYVVDRDVATSTGVTASVPTTLALVEAIAGREKAESVAADVGIESWRPEHDSTLFGLNARRRATFILNKVTGFLRHEEWAIDVHDGSDDIAIALAADAWERTSRVSVLAASSHNPVTLRSGLKLVTEPARPGMPRVPLASELKPVPQLDRTLCEILSRFGPSRHAWVLLEMEYAGAPCPR
jgi:putative intracellular protease/amidase